MRPVRVQRRREKGWRMPENTVYVGRPSRWGNEYSVGGRMQPVVVGDWWDAPFVWHHRGPFIERDGMVLITRDLAAQMFRENASGLNHDYRTRWLAPLRGKNLACWCPLDQPCHADVLLELANA